MDRDEYLAFYRELATFLASHNVASLRFDFRGHGKSDVSQREFSPVGQVLDLVGAVNFLEGQPGVARLPRCSFATSFAAPPTIFMSKVLKGSLSKLYFLAPVLDYDLTFLNPKTEWASESFNQNTVSGAYKNGSLVLGEDFEVGMRALVEMSLLNPIDVATSLSHLPMRIVHGAADTMVPIEQSKRLASLSKSVSFLTIEGMDHGYNALGDDEGVAPESQKNKEMIFADFLQFCSP
jgi:hypothetical protein